MVFVFTRRCLARVEDLGNFCLNFILPLVQVISVIQAVQGVIFRKTFIFFHFIVHWGKQVPEWLRVKSLKTFGV